MDIERHNRRQIEQLNQRGGRMLSIVDLIRAGTISVEMVAYAMRAMAVAWAEREARLKCLKLGLVEWTPVEAEAECLCHKLLLSDHLIGAVSWKQALGSRR
jgi:hypothetical protein